MIKTVVLSFCVIAVIACAGAKKSDIDFKPLDTLSTEDLIYEIGLMLNYGGEEELDTIEAFADGTPKAAFDRNQLIYVMCDPSAKVVRYVKPCEPKPPPPTVDPSTWRSVTSSSATLGKPPIAPSEIQILEKTPNHVDFIIRDVEGKSYFRFWYGFGGLSIQECRWHDVTAREIDEMKSKGIWPAAWQ